MPVSDIGTGTLLAGDSREYRLGAVLAEGGEGIVYRVQARDDVLAKIYKEWEYGIDTKLRGLIAIRSKRLRRVAAWPLSPLSDERDSAVGFVMESLDEWQPLHSIYQIRWRMQFAPHRTWAFLLRVARNLATCVHHVHEHGLVIGDLNESNILVGPDAMVKLIDADSFQIRIDDKLYPCKVAKPELLAPELHGQSLAGTERTPDQDLFALAALIYQTLVFGRHPFAGRPTQEAEMPLETAIQKGWYVFGTRRDSPLLPPPYLTLDWLPPEIRELFERAFDPDEPARPTAREWFTALKELEGALGGCDINGSHVFWRQARRCPWCALEEKWNIILFRPAPLDPLSAADFDIEEVWRRISALPVPTAAEAPRPIDYLELTPAKVPGWKVLLMRPLVSSYTNASFWLIYLIILFGHDALAAPLVIKFFIVLAVTMYVAQLVVVERIRRRVRIANVRLEEISQRWESEAATEIYSGRVLALERMKAELVANSDRYEAARQTRIRQLHQDDLDRHLRKYSLLAADVGAASRQKLSNLLDRGVLSAADIVPANQFKSKEFEADFWADLVKWREALEASFWSATSYGLPPNEERTILEKIHREDIEIRRELLAGQKQLEDISSRIRGRQEELMASALPYQRTVREYGSSIAAYEHAKKRGLIAYFRQKKSVS